MKITYIFLILFSIDTSVLFSQTLQNDEYYEKIKTLDSLFDEKFYEELEEGNQKFWERYVKIYAEKYNLPESDFPKEIPSEISLRMKAIPIPQLKEMIKDPKYVKEAEKQFKDILDGIRTKKWKPFSQQEWMRSQSGHKKPADQKEIDRLTETKTEDKIDLKIEDDEYSFFKQPWVIALAVFIIFVLTAAIFKKGK